MRALHSLHNLSMASLESRRALSISDLAHFVGAPARTLSRGLTSFIRSCDFRYRRLNMSERDAVMRHILEKLEGYDRMCAIPGDGKKRWEREWKSAYRSFVNGSFKLGDLAPVWLSCPQAVRLDGDYALPTSSCFNLNYFRVLLQWIAETYLSRARVIHEFGCGSGFNVLQIAKLLPTAEVHGSDWSPYTKKIIETARVRLGARVYGHQFNMLTPRRDFSLSPSTAVLTVGSLEQLHDHFDAFLRYLLAQKPSIVVHVEPIVEWYDTGTLFGFLGASFHKKRRYLHGFFPRLRALEKGKKLRILKAQPARMGSIYHDSYAIIVWKPR